MSERPIYTPAPKQKWPYSTTAATCPTCKLRSISGDYGLLPDECEYCQSERERVFYYLTVRWLENELDRVRVSADG